MLGPNLQAELPNGVLREWRDVLVVTRGPTPPDGASVPRLHGGIRLKFHPDIPSHLSANTVTIRYRYSSYTVESLVDTAEATE